MPLKLVTMDNVHEIIPSYIEENKHIISSYEDMAEIILRMIRAKYFFSMDKNILRGCLEDLTYMYCPGDDVNKDRVMAMLEPSDDEDDEEDEDEDDGSMDFLRQMMGGMGGMGVRPPARREEPKEPRDECETQPEDHGEECNDEEEEINGGELEEINDVK